MARLRGFGHGSGFFDCAARFFFAVESDETPLTAALVQGSAFFSVIAASFVTVSLLEGRIASSGLFRGSAVFWWHSRLAIIATAFRRSVPRVLLLVGIMHLFRFTLHSFLRCFRIFLLLWPVCLFLWTWYFAFLTHVESSAINTQPPTCLSCFTPPHRCWQVCLLRCVHLLCASDKRLAVLLCMRFVEAQTVSCVEVMSNPSHRPQSAAVPRVSNSR